MCFSRASSTSQRRDDDNDIYNLIAGIWIRKSRMGNWTYMYGKVLELREARKVFESSWIYSKFSTRKKKKKVCQNKKENCLEYFESETTKRFLMKILRCWDDASSIIVVVVVIVVAVVVVVIVVAVVVVVVIFVAVLFVVVVSQVERI